MLGVISSLSLLLNSFSLKSLVVFFVDVYLRHVLMEVEHERYLKNTSKQRGVGFILGFKL